MDKVDIKQVTGHSQEELDAIALNALGVSNPALAATWNRLLEKGAKKDSDKKFVITPAMRAGAAENEAFQKPRQQE